VNKHAASSDQPQTNGRAWLRAALYRYERPLIRYAKRLTGNLESARDLVQDTFVQLCRQEQVKVGQHVGAWLFTVCRRKAIDLLRKEKRMSSLSEAAIASQTAADPPPHLAAEIGDTAQHVLSLVATLPPKQQNALRLKFQDGLSYREIAAAMDVTINNVGVLIHTGLTKLRSQLNQDPTTAANPDTKPAAGAAEEK
jgi:RNA polymerase sigma factor (sigma-70 family)